MSQQSFRGFLEGIRVVEYGSYISAAFCAHLLEGLGTDVIKVEPPEGEEARRAGPFPKDAPHPEKSGLFLALNSNKRGVTLNPATVAGRKLFLALVKDADVLVENHPPGYMADLGLGYETLRKANPRLVVVSITPFGQEGPWKGWLATDLVLMNLSNVSKAISLEVAAGHADERPPIRAGGHQAGFWAGLAGATAAAMALTWRDLSGAGRHVDVSALETLIAMNESPIAQQGFGAPPRGRTTLYDWQRGTHLAILPCKDGYFGYSPREEHQWVAWLKVMGDPSWGQDPRFKTDAVRREHYAVLEPLLLEWTMQYGKEEIYRKAQAHRVPCFPVNTPADLFRSPQLAARGVFVEVEHPLAGKLPLMREPFRVLGEAERMLKPAPLLGQHNEEVFCEMLGVARDELPRLRGLGAI
jgi:crotonobetainyl-CoA:carnitine CoA-transferase CaiB-like acyl-CoA transferase